MAVQDLLVSAQDCHAAISADDGLARGCELVIDEELRVHALDGDLGPVGRPRLIATLERHARKLVGDLGHELVLCATLV